MADLDPYSLLMGEEPDAKAQAQAYAAALRGQKQLSDIEQLSGNPTLAAAGQRGAQEYGQGQQQLGKLLMDRLERQTQAKHYADEQQYRQGELDYRNKALAQGKYTYGRNPATGELFKMNTATGEAEPISTGAALVPSRGGAPKAGDIDKALAPIVSDLDPAKGKTGKFGADYAVIQSADKINRLTNYGKNLNLIPQQMTELSTSVAGLLANGSAAAQAQIDHLTPKTLKGNAAGIAQWLTGDPTGAEQQEFARLFVDTANRESAGAKSRIKDVQLNRLPAHVGVYASHPDEAKALVKQYLPDLSDEDLDAAFHGKYDRGGADMVSVVSPEGKAGRIPRAKLEAAKARGFKLAGP